MHAAPSILFPGASERVRAGAGSFALIATGQATVRTVANSLLAGLSDARNDRVRFLTDSTALAEAVMKQVARTFADSAGAPRSALSVFWQHRAEVLVAADAPALVRAADNFAPRRLQVLSTPHEWWLARLCAYGSLMLGDEPPALFGAAAGCSARGARHRSGPGLLP